MNLNLIGCAIDIRASQNNSLALCSDTQHAEPSINTGTPKEGNTRAKWYIIIAKYLLLLH